MTSPADEITAPASLGSSAFIPATAMADAEPDDGAQEQGLADQTNLESMLRLARAW